RQIRTISFDHELPERHPGRHFPDVRAVLERYDAGERNQMIELEDLIRLFERSAKAMEDAAHFTGGRPHDVERVLPGVPLMNDYVQSQFDCEIELLFKQTRLFRFVSAVVDF